MSLQLALIAGLHLPCALAEDRAHWDSNTGPYVGLEAGANFLSHEGIHEDGGDEVTTSYFRTGFLAGLTGGYRFNNGLRPELELSHRRNKISRTDSTDPKDVMHGFHNNDALMANLWYDVPVPHVARLHPYLGGGIGGARIDAQTYGEEGPGVSQTVFAWQGGAGIAYDVAPHWTVSGDWRYIHTSQARVERAFETAPENGRGIYMANTAMLSVRYMFGLNESRETTAAAPPPAPAAPLPPPAVPPPEPVTVMLQTVNFQFDATDLTPAARATLDDVARTIRERPSLRVRIEGNTDAIGSERYNQALSERRADAVRDYLVDRGVPANQLDVIGLGESHPIADNDTPEGRAANRRADFAAQGRQDDIHVRIEGPTEESKHQAQRPARGHRPDPGSRHRKR